MRHMIRRNDGHTIMDNKDIQKEIQRKTSIPLLIANVTLVGFVVSFGFMIYKTRQEKPVVALAPKKMDTSAFDHMDVQAQSIFVWDINKDQSIYAKNENVVRPLASITKIMSAITALSILPKNSPITINKEFLAEEGDSGLYVNEQWNFKNLLDFSLMVSSNDGIHSIAAVAGAFASGQNMENPDYNIGLNDFISKMNQKAAVIGLSSLHFNNETGLDVTADESGGYGSAEDVAKLIEYAMKNYPDVLEVTKNKTEVFSSLEKTHDAVNTDEAISKIPNLIASKTGYTSLSGGNLAVVFDAGVGRPIAIVVLDSTYDGRFTDVEQLASSTLRYIQDNNL